MPQQTDPTVNRAFLRTSPTDPTRTKVNPIPGTPTPTPAPRPSAPRRKPPAALQPGRLSPRRTVSKKHSEILSGVK
jgi:hypothetical protein